MFVPRAGGQAGGHMENASMAGAEPASFVPPSVPSMALPTHQEMPSRGPWLYCQGRRVLLFAILGGHCRCASPCARYSMFTTFILTTLPICRSEN